MRGEGEEGREEARKRGREDARTRVLEEERRKRGGPPPGWQRLCPPARGRRAAGRSPESSIFARARGAQRRGWEGRRCGGWNEVGSQQEGGSEAQRTQHASSLLPSSSAPASFSLSALRSASLCKLRARASTPGLGPWGPGEGRSRSRRPVRG